MKFEPHSVPRNHADYIMGFFQLAIKIKKKKISVEMEKFVDTNEGTSNRARLNKTNISEKVWKQIIGNLFEHQSKTPLGRDVNMENLKVKLCTTNIYI